MMVALALGAAAPADPEVGRWIDEMFEIDSRLELTADGRFHWDYFEGGAELVGEGRWTREADGNLRLDSDPPVVAPRLLLAGRERAAEPGVVEVMLDLPVDQAAFFTAIGEAPGREPVGVPLSNGLASFPAEDGIETVRVGFLPYGILSEPVAAAPGERLTFWFEANDFGRFDFQGAHVRMDGERLQLNLGGRPLDYVRVESVELGPDE